MSTRGNLWTVIAANTASSSTTDKYSNHKVIDFVCGHEATYRVGVGKSDLLTQVMSSTPTCLQELRMQQCPVCNISGRHSRPVVALQTEPPTSSPTSMQTLGGAVSAFAPLFTGAPLFVDDSTALLY